MKRNMVDCEIVIINIGRSNPPGPMFEDNTFRFVPIRESQPTKRTPTYKDLGLSDWVPDPTVCAHYDPEFGTMTFGDYENPRTNSARQLKPEDLLFFFASLSRDTEKARRKASGLYVVGYFEIKRIIYPPESGISTLTRNNAHVKRSDDSDFIIWKGTSRSSLLEKAVPIDRRNADLFLRTSTGAKLPWGSLDKYGRRRSDLEVVNSATRSSRRILPQHRAEFVRVIQELNPKTLLFVT